MSCRPCRPGMQGEGYTACTTCRARHTRPGPARHGSRPDGLLVSWGLGAMGSWCHGVLVSWALGVMGSWCHGLLVPWALGAMGSWCHGVLVPWGLGVMGSWCHEVLVPWALGAMGSWCHGVLVSWAPSLAPCRAVPCRPCMQGEGYTARPACPACTACTTCPASLWLLMNSGISPTSLCLLIL